ncbi:MAG: Coenzyme F420 hydrogenase/dehydrogenase, beta subunit C-terminal domain, partial [Prevotellaceae bacterium]|nr:Coenzyme F420 hydrogenase/dehydrogenase, beta subunit C-terminal domain [Candidatus Faecinaster equi]
MNLKIQNIENDCTGCGSCANICPKHCLEMKPNAEGFYYPVYNPADCITCGLCEKTCHVLYPQTVNGSSSFFFCYRTKDEELREKSSSGGAFSLFAGHVLSKGGLVFGSVYDGEIGKLVVKNTDCVPLDSLRKSKYIESFTSRSWTEIKQSLLKNRQTLFCGTPCQVSGLLSFLRQAHVDTKNLITIDFACHGVPSNKCFSEFIKFFTRGENTVTSADFRYKDFKKNIGWHNMVLALGLSNGKKKVIKYNK